MDEPRLFPAGNGASMKAALFPHAVQEFRSVFRLADRARRNGDRALYSPRKHKAAELVQAAQTARRVPRIEPSGDQGGLPQLDHHLLAKHRLEGGWACD